jgi:AcrR family transcriptional regulator
MSDNLINVKIETAAGQRSSYHHGALREALLTIGEAVLIERGPAGFSVREVTRRAGVSPAAHLHHFKDGRALLTAIAARGFERLTAALTGAAERGAGTGGQLEAQGRAYIDFALRNDALFTLMWRRDILDGDDPNYLSAGRAAFNAFEQVALGRETPVATGPHKPDAAVVAAWAMIHGYARLALDGALGDSVSELLPDVLRYVPDPTSRCAAVASPGGGRRVPPDRR